MKNVQFVRVRQTNGPYVHSKYVFHYRRFVNRNEALPWFFISGLKILNLKVFKLIHAHLFLVKVL